MLCVKLCEKKWPGSDNEGTNCVCNMSTIDMHSMKHLNSQIFGVRMRMSMVGIRIILCLWFAIECEYAENGTDAFECVFECQTFVFE